MNPRPFYPAQTATGETYVVDGRTGKVVRSIASSFDTTERWGRAKQLAKQMNAEHVGRVYAVRQRASVGCLVLLAVLFVVEVGSGDLSRLADAVISSIP